MTAHQYIQLHNNELKSLAASVAYQYHLDRDDLHQELAIRLLRFQNSINGRPKHEHLTWAARICWNLAVDISRKKKYTILPIEEVWYKTATPSSADDRQHLAKLLLGIRQRLSTRHAYVIYKYATGWKLEEIAVLTGYHVSKVKQMMRAVRKELQVTNPTKAT